MKAPREIADKLKTVESAWETIAPTKSFAGMTLIEFKAKVKPSLDARDSLQTVDTQRTETKVQREQNDERSLNAMQLVVNSIKGDPDEGGEDGALYAACGYVRKSDRKSGLSRKAKAAVTPVKPLT